MRAAFPDMSGFSPRNLRDMKRFYLAYSSETIWPQLVAKLNDKSPSSAIWRQAVAKLNAGEVRLEMEGGK